MPHAIGPVGPPLRTFAPGLVEFEHAVGLRPAEVERDSSSRDDGPHPVVHLASRLVLVEAEVQPASQEVARLRHAARDAPGDAAAHRVRGTEVVLRRVFEERPDIAPRGEAGAEDVGVLGCIHDLVELVDVESAIEADFHGQGRQRQWCREGAATAELPVGAGDRHFTGDDTLHRLVIPRHQRRFCRIQTCRQVGHGIRLHNQRLPVESALVDDAPEHEAGHRRAVGVPGHRNLDEVPATHQFG